VTKVLYLHGFASGPQSKKAVYFASQLSQAGIDCAVPDLNQPDFFSMTLSQQISTALSCAQKLNAKKLVLIGSSMGGLLATILAEQYLDVSALILLAPGFGITSRWPLFLGSAEALATWQKNGSRNFMHYALGREAPLSYEFVRDLEKHPLAMSRPEEIKLKNRALIFHGIDDQTVPYDNSAAVQSNNPGVELIKLEDNHELVTSLPQIWQKSRQTIAPETVLKENLPL